MRADLVERFWRYVDKSADCWEWTGGQTNGYGRFMITHGHTPNAHRVAWELLHGPIPDGAQLDHLCRNRRCVNPDHLEAVSCRVNLRRGDTLAARNAQKTRCPAGHPYDAANTYVDRRGSRSCRECARRRRREWYQNRRSAS